MGRFLFAVAVAILVAILIYPQLPTQPAPRSYSVSCYDENGKEVAQGRWTVHECLTFFMKRKRDE